LEVRRALPQRERESGVSHGVTQSKES
jgi:hypothetical protein